MHSDHSEEFAEALNCALVAARQALAKTPRQLAVLARHHVVDAGGQGFVYFLEGVSEWVRTGGARRPAAAPPAVPPLPFAPVHGEIDAAYRYCAEALLSGVDLDPETAKPRFASLGDSLVVAGGARLRVHLHTNAPQRFMDEAARLGTLESTKVEDMILQQLAGRDATIALVSDSTCDLPEALAYRLGVVRVPLRLTIDGQDYSDGVDMTATEFYRRLPGRACCRRRRSRRSVSFGRSTSACSNITTASYRCTSRAPCRARWRRRAAPPRTSMRAASA